MPESTVFRTEQATRKAEKMADPAFPANNPQMGDDFAAVYEATAHRITGRVSNIEEIAASSIRSILEVSCKYCG